MESKAQSKLRAGDAQVSDLGEHRWEAGGSRSIRPAEEQGGAGGLGGRGTWVRLRTFKPGKDDPHGGQHSHRQG